MEFSTSSFLFDRSKLLGLVLAFLNFHNGEMIVDTFVLLFFDLFLSIDGNSARNRRNDLVVFLEEPNGTWLRVDFLEHSHDGTIVLSLLLLMMLFLGGNVRCEVRRCMGIL